MRQARRSRSFAAPDGMAAVRGVRARQTDERSQPLPSEAHSSGRNVAYPPGFPRGSHKLFHIQGGAYERRLRLREHAVSGGGPGKAAVRRRGVRRLPAARFAMTFSTSTRRTESRRQTSWLSSSAGSDRSRTRSAFPASRSPDMKPMTFWGSWRRRARSWAWR